MSSRGEVRPLADGGSPAQAALEAFRREVAFARALQQPAPATRAILWILAAAFGLGYAVTALAVEPRFGEVDSALRPIIAFAAKVNTQIADGQWWRLVTHTLLHGGFFHFAVNAYALYVLGSITERVFGTSRFVLIYALSGLGGALASWWFNDAASVGASGAIFGVFGAAIVFGYRDKALVPASVARALSSGLLPYLLLSLVVGLLPFVDMAAHVGGLVTGVAVALVVRSPLAGVRPSRAWVEPVLRGVVWGLVVLMMVAVASAADYGAQCLSSASAWEACLAVPLGESE